MATPSRTSIHEANLHLQALYQKIELLTAAVQDRNTLLEIKERQYQHSLAEITTAKDAQILQLKDTLKQELDKTYRLECTNTENQKLLDNLRKKETVLHQIHSFQPTLERLVAVISQTSHSISSDSGVSFNEGTPSLSERNNLQKNEVYLNNSVRRIAHHLQRRKKQFSISEDDVEITDSEGESSEGKAKHQEVYF